MRLVEPCSAIPLRIPRPKIDKLACQAEDVGILAESEIPLLDAYCSFLHCGIYYITQKIILQDLFELFLRFFQKISGSFTICILFPSAGMIFERRSSVRIRRLVVFIHG